jgi:hypothetical protein
MKSSKAVLAEELQNEPPEPPKPKEEPKPPERRLPSQFDIAKRIVDLVHAEWPQAKYHDWTVFYNALFLARGELRRTWQKRKRVEQSV